ncbi:unnamed protein product, partial [Amoebophrya sp. A25]
LISSRYNYRTTSDEAKNVNSGESDSENQWQRFFTRSLLYETQQLRGGARGSAGLLVHVYRNTLKGLDGENASSDSFNN